MTATKRREAERAVVRAATDAREAVLVALGIAAGEGILGHSYEEAIGVLISAIDALENLPRPAINAPSPAAMGRATDTSRIAARLVWPRHGTYRREVYELVAQRPQGATDEELELVLRRPHQTISSARNSLVEDGWLYDSGKRRPTLSNRPAIVWKHNSAVHKDDDRGIGHPEPRP